MQRLGPRVAVLLVAGLCWAAHAAEDSPPPPDKDPTTAAVLGGLAGLGTGYYYAASPAKGAAFTLLDAGLITGLAMADSDGTLWALGAGLAVSHLFQGLDGAAEARRYNRRHASPPPFRVSVGGSLFDGGAPPLMLSAAGLRPSAAVAGPPLALHLSTRDLGLGVSYHTSF